MACRVSNKVGFKNWKIQHMYQLRGSDTLKSQTAGLYHNKRSCHWKLFGKGQALSKKYHAGDWTTHLSIKLLLKPVVQVWIDLFHQKTFSVVLCSSFKEKNSPVLIELMHSSSYANLFRSWHCCFEQTVSVEWFCSSSRYPWGILLFILFIERWRNSTSTTSHSVENYTLECRVLSLV